MIDEILWTIGNVLIAAIFVLAFLFCFLYLALFNPRRTTGGWLIWQAIFSITCIGLVNVVGIYLSDVWWRPGFRAVVYTLVAYNFGRLVGLLIYRRFWPHKVRIGSESVDEQTLSPRPRVRKKR